MRLKGLSYYLLLVTTILSYAAAGQGTFENVIEVDGVTMTSDSLRAVGNVTVLIRNKNRGVESKYTGVFSIVCDKGDTLEFSCVGFRPRQFVVPANASGQYLPIYMPMVQDTFYLPETIIRPLPSKEAFTYAFQHWRVPSDQYELARRNTNHYIMRALAYTLPRDGQEMQARLQQQQANEAVYYGQQQPMNLLNPIAWGQFFEAWKRGDFRSQQDNPYNGTGEY